MLQLTQCISVFYMLSHFQDLDTDSQACCIEIIPYALKWAKIAVEKENEELSEISFTCLRQIGDNPPKDVAIHLPDIIDLWLMCKCGTDLNCKCFSFRILHKKDDANLNHL